MLTSSVAHARMDKPCIAEDNVGALAIVTVGDQIGRVSELCAGQTAQRLHERTGIHGESIRCYLRGHSALTVEFVARLCLATGASAEWLLFAIGSVRAEGRRHAGQARSRG